MTSHFSGDKSTIIWWSWRYNVLPFFIIINSTKFEFFQNLSWYRRDFSNPRTSGIPQLFLYKYSFVFNIISTKNCASHSKIIKKERKISDPYSYLTRLQIRSLEVKHGLPPHKGAIFYLRVQQNIPSPSPPPPPTPNCKSLSGLLHVARSETIKVRGDNPNSQHQRAKNWYIRI